MTAAKLCHSRGCPGGALHKFMDFWGSLQIVASFNFTHFNWGVGDLNEGLQSFLLLGLLRSLRHLTSASLALLDVLDDTNGNCLPHVTDGKATKWGIFGELLNAHGLLGYHLDHGSITRLHALGGGLKHFAATAINFLLQLLELARNVGRVAVEDGGVSSLDRSGVVQDDHLHTAINSLTFTVLQHIPCTNNLLANHVTKLVNLGTTKQVDFRK